MSAAVAGVGDGDTASAMSLSPPEPLPDAPDVLVDLEVRRQLARLVERRVWLSPLIAAAAAFFGWWDPAPWRLALLGVVAVVAMVGSVVAARRTVRLGVAPWSLPMNVGAMWALQLAMIAGTGGLDSPVLPVMVPLGLVAGLVIPRREVLAGLVAAEASLLLTVAAWQTSGWGPTLALPGLGERTAGGRWFAAGAMVLVLVVTANVGRFLRGRLEAVVAAAITSRSEQLGLWEAHGRDLQRLGAEIAHELKNPLAAIKGLGALVARDVPEGRGAERLGVLRSEVDRMQDILEAFLTFSRPLVPLTLARVDLRRLVDEVAAIHEAVAEARRVRIVVRGGPMEVRGDPRKLTQVLVNLVQNALHASPDGSVIDVTVTGDVAVEVADRGPGVPPGLADRVFEAGVTGRADGSGLGLAVAQAIARQHGGDVSLAARDGGGTVATLRLPAEREGG